MDYGLAIAMGLVVWFLIFTVFVIVKLNRIVGLLIGRHHTH